MGFPTGCDGDSRCRLETGTMAKPISEDLRSRAVAAYVGCVEPGGGGPVWRRREQRAALGAALSGDRERVAEADGREQVAARRAPGVASGAGGREAGHH